MSLVRGLFQYCQYRPLNAALGFDSQVHCQFTIDAIDTFVIELKAYYIANIGKTQTPIFIFMGELDEPIGNQKVVIFTLVLIAVASLADLKRLNKRNVC